MREVREANTPEPRTFRVILRPDLGQASSRLKPVAELLRSAGCTVHVDFTTTVAEARAVAGEAAGRGEIILACGGDGTVRCMAGALAGTTGLLGVIPAGRGNDFGRDLRLPHTPEAVASLLLAAPVRTIDVLRVDGETVAGNVYAGLDSAANKLANRSRFTPNGLVYPLAGLRALVKWQPAEYTLEVDGQVSTHTAFSVVVANTGFYGGGLHVAPAAVPDDGLLDVVVLGATSKRHFPTAMREMRAGTHVNRPFNHAYRGRRVTVRADRTLPVYGDGDPVTAAREFTVELVPSALSVIGRLRAADQVEVDASATDRLRGADKTVG